MLVTPSQSGSPLYVKVYNSQDDSVCFEVQDFGHGIPKENLSKVFTPLFTTKPKGMGTGLGLSLSQKIVHSLNGKNSHTK